MMFAMPLFNKKRRPSKTGLAVRVETTLCAHCMPPDHNGGSAIALTDIALAGTGWVGKGTISQCLMCASAARAIRKEIPILASEFRCPVCEELEHLEYRIKRINASRGQPGRFEFEVEISCEPCTRKRILRSNKDSLKQTTEIEVTPEGVTFKR